MAQQAFVLYWGDNVNTNLGDLNNLLGSGQRVVMASPMSGTGATGPTSQSQWPYSRAALILDATGGPAQTALVLWFADTGNTNLGDLNNLLSQNWQIAQLIALSGTGEKGGETPGSPFPYSRALAILHQ